MPRLEPDDPRLAAPDFPHGTERGYNRSCPCGRCREAHTEYRWEQLHGRPRPESVRHSESTADARRHIDQLLVHPGVIPSAIARAAGLSVTSVLNIRRKPTVYADTIEAVLAVTLDDVISEQKLVDAQPSRLHINRLLTGEDASYAAIAAAAGLAYDAIPMIAEGERSTIARSTARAILRLTPYVVRRNAAFVSSSRTITRMRALQANGWPIKVLGSHIGIAAQNILRDCRPYVTQETERSVAKFYEEIGDKPGGSVRAQNQARRLGYYPPIHYDDDMRLIPESIPSSVRQPKVTGQDRARNKLRMLGLVLREQSGAEIAQLLDISVKTVERVRGEIGLRCDPNARELVPYIKPGQDALVALVARHVARIALREPTSLLDAPGLDYAALWSSLRAGAERLHAEVEAWEMHAARHSAAAALAA